MELSGTQRIILTRLSDGCLHNLFAWPLAPDVEDVAEQARFIWAAAMLVAKGLASHEEPTDDTLWLTITDAGREALEAK